MKIIDSITLGATIRARRKELGYTQSDLAEFTGFSISFISDLERGKKTAEIGKALQLIQLLGMDIKIEKYIEDYENRRITVSEIAEKENASISTISSKIKKYYNLRREQKLKTVKKSKSDLIEKYIEDLENGKITPKELAEKLLVSQSSINMLIREFYKSKNRTEPKYRRLTK